VACQYKVRDIMGDVMRNNNREVNT